MITSARYRVGMPLSPRQARFVEEYVASGVASKSAARAGYKEKSARAQGSRLLANPEIQAAISEGELRRA